MRALIFDSFYDAYRGAIAYVCVKEGTLHDHDRIFMMAGQKSFDVTELGVHVPGEKKVRALAAGEVGYVAASMKEVADTRVGDTITTTDRPAEAALPGYQKATPMVYCGLYPVDNEQYPELKDALIKLSLNDAALEYEPETSQALGFGFRCGFLGMLHMEIIQERLEREYNLDLITTAPSVIYHVYLTDGSMVQVDNPALMPTPQKIDHIEEPFARVQVMVPSDYVGPVMELGQERRGRFKDMQFTGKTRATVIYDMPLGEIVFDFFDQLKTRTRGYASLEYELGDYEASHLVKLDVLVNGEVVDALSCIVHRDKAYHRGRALAAKLKELLPRQQFEVPIQAAIGNKVIARETVKALRKNVLDKCYGGDISRKRKLLEKQKEGKKRMKQVGNVEIPQEAFMAVLSLNDTD